MDLNTKQTQSYKVVDSKWKSHARVCAVCKYPTLNNYRL